jgi:hypothetical protein
MQTQHSADYKLAAIRYFQQHGNFAETCRQFQCNPRSLLKRRCPITPILVIFYPRCSDVHRVVEVLWFTNGKLGMSFVEYEGDISR